MAIFGKADINLPLIVQAAQVDTTNDKEVKAFFIRCGGIVLSRYAMFRPDTVTADGLPLSTDAEEMEHSVEIYLHAISQMQIEYPEGVSIGNPEVLLLKHYKSLYEAITWIMLGLSESPPMVNTVALKKLRSEGSNRQDTKFVYIEQKIKTSETSRSVEQQDQPVMLPIADYAESIEPLSFNIVQPTLLGDVERLLLDVLRGQEKVMRCGECHSPFIPRRADHIYCSHRCANRAALRKKRKGKSSLYSK